MPPASTSTRCSRTREWPSICASDGPPAVSLSTRACTFPWTTSRRPRASADAPCFATSTAEDALIAAALSDALNEYHASLAIDIDADAQQTDAPLEQWLESLAARFQQAVIDGGLAYWQMTAAADDDLPAALAVLNRRRREARKTSTVDIANAAWRRAGGSGVPPKIVIDSVALTFSAFTTRSMVHDYGTPHETVGRTTARLLSCLIEHEVVTQSHTVFDRS